MEVKDYIKILYSKMGYLPNHPYHLISDEEMFDAFLKEDGFFADFYPCPDSSLEDKYTALLQCIKEKVTKHLKDNEELPNWIYSYMSLNVTTFNSSERDLDYLAGLLGIEFNSGLSEFNPQVASACYEVSSKWIQKQPSKYANRVPTIFGEPHVIKSLRLDQANMLLSN